MLRIGRDLVGSTSDRGDTSKPHLMVYPLTRTTELQLEQVVEAIQPQSGIFLVQFHQFPFQRLIVPLTHTGFAMQLGIVPLRDISNAWHSCSTVAPWRCMA